MGDDTEIQDLLGRPVYSVNGTRIGTVDDFVFDFSNGARTTKLAITDVNHEATEGHAQDARGLRVPYSWVRSAGDAVLLRDTIERLRPAAPEVV